MQRLLGRVGQWCTGLVILAVAACGAQDPTPTRQEMLGALTEQVIVPRYTEVAKEAQGLAHALQQLCAAPSREQLDLAQQAWYRARGPWMRAQAVGFGPVELRRTHSYIDWHPIDPDRIEKALVSRETITPADVREFMSSAQRGLGTVEFLLFGPADDILADLAAPHGLRCQYLTALGEVIAVETATVVSDWTGAGAQDDSAYADIFAGRGPSALLDSAAVDELVRSLVFLCRTIVDMQLGQALGINDGVPDPAALPGGAGHNAAADLRNQVLGMRDIYLGSLQEDDTGLGLSLLVRALSAETDDSLRAAFQTVLAALEEPLALRMAENPAPAQEAYASLKTLQRALNTEVVSLLGVSVGFSDTDGDGR